MPPPAVLRQIRAAKTEEEVVQIVEGAQLDWASPYGLQGKEQIEKIRHREMRPKPWYRQPATWIAFGSLLVSVGSLIVAILALRH